MGLTKHYNKIPFRELKDEALEANGTGGFLTKPCPLMPDGKWVKYELTINDNTDPTNITITKSEDIDGLSIFCNSDNIFLLINTYSCQYMFGECRMTIDKPAATSTNISIQGTYGWQVRQSQHVYYCAQGSNAFSQFSNGTKIAFYAYLIPNDFSIEET